MNKDYVFAVYVKKLPVMDAKTTREKIRRKAVLNGQNYLFNSVFKNLGNEKPPQNEDEGCVYFINTKQQCEKHDQEFWETGTVEIVKAAEQNIKAKRYPSFVRKALLSIVSKNKNINDMFRMFCTYFSVIVSTKVDTFENFDKNKEDSLYFSTPK